MQISSFFDVARRRWLALVLVVLLGIAGGAFAWTTTRVHYNAETIAVVVPPAGDQRNAPVNPLGQLGNETNQTAALVVTLMQSPGVAESLQPGAAIVSATNVLDTTSANPQYSPRITLVTEAESAEQATVAADAVLAATRTQFGSLQKSMHTPSTATMRIETLVPAHATASDRSNKLRATAGTALGIIVLGVLLVLVWDMLRSRSLRRRHDATQGGVPNSDSP